MKTKEEQLRSIKNKLVGSTVDELIYMVAECYGEEVLKEWKNKVELLVKSFDGNIPQQDFLDDFRKIKI
jgi:hypothetical protein